jgi:large subunit ribosomal protein L21
MYAIIVAGASQHKVVEGERLRIDLLADKKKGDAIVFDRVLMVGADSGHKIGTPAVAGASVHATVVDMGANGEGVLGEKLWALKRFPGKYRKHRGHRQRYTTIRIDKIVG